MPKLPQHIEKRFDKEFLYPFGDGSRNAIWSLSMENELKSFIATILDEERERILKKIEEELTYIGVLESNERRRGYDMACQEIINLIKEDEKNNL